MDGLFKVILELIIADLILGGDNAVVIAMATKGLDSETKKKASFIGAALAIILRVIFVTIIMFMGEMHIPFLNIIAGVLLIHIALGLLNPHNEEDGKVNAQQNIKDAVKTIVFADAIMSLDNAIVIASIAAGAGLAMTQEVLLVIFALLFSFPIILFGASLLSKILDRFKALIYVFAFLLIHTGIEMLLKDPLLHDFHNTIEEYRLTKYIIWLIAIILIIIKEKTIKNKEGDE